MNAQADPAPDFKLLYALLLPVILIPAVVITVLVIRGDQLERHYNRGLSAAASGDFAAAQYNFEKAGAMGHAESDCKLVTLYRTGILTANDVNEEILRLLTRAALNGSLEAEFELGKLAENGPEADNKLAALHYRRAALGGHVQGLLAMGRLHEHGLGVNQSSLLAKEFYLKAAENKAPEAYVALGLLYINKNKEENDYRQAVKYLELAARANVPRAFTALGYINEQLYPDDAQKQIKTGKYYKRAAELRDPEGTVNYADYLLQHGLNQEAVKYYRAAAEKLNFPLAYHRLGMFYYQQPEADYARARRYFEHSASAGNSSSWINLGIMAELGQGSAIDLKRAMECYQMAAKLGHADAANRIKNLQDTPAYKPAPEKN